MHQIITIVAKDFVFIPVIVLVFLFYKADKPARIRLAIFLVVAAVVTAVLVKIANMVHSDPRPFISDGVKPYFSSSIDNGFPSDHTVFSAAIALVIFTVSKKWGVAIFVLSAVIGGARVIAGVHHTQDVVAGLIIAALGYGIAMLIVGRIYKKS